MDDDVTAVPDDLGLPGAPAAPTGAPGRAGPADPTRAGGATGPGRSGPGSWAPEDWSEPAAGGGASPLLGWVRSLEQASALDGWVERARPLGDLLSSGRVGDVLGGAPLGHALHPLLTDVPIGCWTSAGVLDLLGGRRARPAAQRLTGLGVLAVAPTALSGWSDFGRIEDPGDRRVAVVHAAGNAVATVAHYRSWRARRRGRHARGVLLGLLGNTVATATGFLGGHLAIGRGVGSGERGVGPTDR